DDDADDDADGVPQTEAGGAGRRFLTAWFHRRCSRPGGPRASARGRILADLVSKRAGEFGRPSSYRGRRFSPRPLTAGQFLLRSVLMVRALDRCFGLRQHGTTVGTELLG